VSEYIFSEGDDAWRCLCGNTPDADGFIPIQKDREVEPTPTQWTSGEYCCLRCGRVIDHTNRQVTRHLDPTDIILLIPTDAPVAPSSPEI
jgi:hypothetical protein